ncbi:hypothetical protein [Streptomyces goshikiensis]|uniref:hypothetical protein n=1 Tax=Streptomyces goshikiensis TaxID=1942 RepID=UPI0036C342CC
MMPKKAETGTTTIDLLDYLFGPGERDEHTDPHLVAGWDPDLPCPARHPGRMPLADLALLLDALVEALRGPRPEEHVWHVSVRNAPGDRLLSDAEWSEGAAAMVHAAGIAPAGDEQACRWIAVQHADDHIHIAATLARQDGRHPRVRGDIPAMHAAARAFEARWGLTQISPLDRTARRPVTGEAEEAAGCGLAETERESLQRTTKRKLWVSEATPSRGGFFVRPGSAVPGPLIALPPCRGRTPSAGWESRSLPQAALYVVVPQRGLAGCACFAGPRGHMSVLGKRTSALASSSRRRNCGCGAYRPMRLPYSAAVCRARSCCPTSS